MKTYVKKTILSVTAMAVCALFLTINAAATTVHTVAPSDTGKMSKMSKMKKPSKMKTKKMSKMDKMSKDTSKMSKM